MTLTTLGLLSGTLVGIFWHTVARCDPCPFHLYLDVDTVGVCIVLENQLFQVEERPLVVHMLADLLGWWQTVGQGLVEA